MIPKNILLIELEYPNKFPSLGLMELTACHGQTAGETMWSSSREDFLGSWNRPRTAYTSQPCSAFAMS